MSLSFLLSLNVPTEHAHEIEYFLIFFKRTDPQTHRLTDKLTDRQTNKQLRFYTFPWKVKMFFGK